MKLKLNFFLLIILFLIGSVNSKAGHIIGGEMTYICDGSGSTPNTRAYTFTLTLYRGCAGALFDNPGSLIVGTVSIYQGDSNIEYQNITLDFPNIESINYNTTDPCLVVPPDVCGQSGTYTFSVELPIISESYHIVYQRCCRDNSIVNLLNPGGSGATFGIELLPSAQALCNSSPVFNDFPTSIICVNENVNIDNTAIDSDGDLLVYSFCSPLLGGSTLDFAPNPDAPPPYNNIDFLAPTYTATSPLGGNPQVTIDPNSGTLVGLVNTQGKFAVGICVEEFRNGELLSKVRRDYQFNISTCNPVNEAIVNNPSNIVDGIYIYENCSDSTITFLNNSDGQNIFEYEWFFDLGNNQSLSFNTEDVTVTFPGIGIYSGFMAINPGSGCDDTLFIEVNIQPKIGLDFDYSYDSCSTSPIVFTPYTVIDESNIAQWDWEFGDGNFSIESNPLHQYDGIGNWPVSLTATNDQGCSQTVTDQIAWFPIPEILITSDVQTGCTPTPISFTNLSNPINTSYDIFWDFGDENTSTEEAPTHIYEEAGLYDVNVKITSPLDCTIETEYSELIFIQSFPTADFSFTPDQPNSLAPQVTFTDLSYEAVSWEWTFDDFGNSNLQNPTFVFPDTGLMEIKLVVANTNGCQDSMIQYLDIEPLIFYYIPNAFSPNDDGINDVFKIEGDLLGVKDFQMYITNRWGGVVYESDSPLQGWDGKNIKGKTDKSNMGVYVVYVRFRSPRGKFYEYKGDLTLM